MSKPTATSRPAAAKTTPAALPATLQALAVQGLQRRYRKHAFLIEEGSTGDTLFILLSGRVRVFSQADNGREITFGVHGRGEYVGEMSLDGGLRSANVQALEATNCAVISRALLTSHIAAQPEFAFELLARVIRRARLATTSARNMALIDVYGRLVALFNSLSEAQTDGTRTIKERLTHIEIAQRIGSSRAMVSRQLRDLEDGGFIALHNQRYSLLKKLPDQW